MSTEPSETLRPIPNLASRLRRSLLDSVGDVAFGMEDGAVSIAGLVFGVAASTDDAKIVLLAGATGAVAGAVSMMAGTYLDVHSERSVAKAQVDRLRRRIEANPDSARERVVVQLRQSGFTDEEADAVSSAFTRNPRAMLDHVAAYEVGMPRPGGASPRAHALWMFFADLMAAGVPVLPFALFPMETARIVSLVITGALMALLGIARGLVGHEPLWRTTLQTMTIAGAAALAGVLIGRLVTS
jgi:VIT1/CCC1 family predicted Fe2+/Mn2+ transporter